MFAVASINLRKVEFTLVEYYITQGVTVYTGRLVTCHIVWIRSLTSYQVKNIILTWARFVTIT